MKTNPRSAPFHARRRGFTLYEVAISTFLVGTLLVSATRTFSSSVKSQSLMANRTKAAWLADMLAAEIHQQSYMEPGASSSAITRESGESGTSRVNYDDVDDYDAWNQSPPQYKDGTTIPNSTGWRQTVSVLWVNANNVMGASVGSETGVKRVTVTIQLNAVTLAQRVLVRTKRT